MRLLRSGRLRHGAAPPSFVTVQDKVGSRSVEGRKLRRGVLKGSVVAFITAGECVGRGLQPCRRQDRVARDGRLLLPPDSSREAGGILHTHLQDSWHPVPC